MRASYRRLFFHVLFVLLSSRYVAYNNTKEIHGLQTKGRDSMTAKEKTTLIKQAGKLYTLGLSVEKHREKLRRLVAKNTPYDSPQMKMALEEFQKIDEEWKRLEKEHLRYRNTIGVKQEVNLK